MKYLGGKYRIGKSIADIINSADVEAYMEPFCGSCWVTMWVRHKPIAAADNNFYLIELWKALKDGWEPPDEVSEDDYNAVKENPDLFTPAYVAFVAFGSSWGGKWFGGYARGKNNNGVSRNYAGEAKRSLKTKINRIGAASFYHADFTKDDFIAKNALIYCDPPYAGTTQYDYYNNKFDHDVFWERCRDLSKQNIVLVSEYAAPSDFVEVARFNTKTDLLDKDKKHIERLEKLFVHEERMKS